MYHTVCMQLEDLVDTSTGLPARRRDNIVSVLNWNVLEAIQRFCEGPASAEEYCADISPTTSLPVGDSFHRATYSMLLNEYQGTFELAGRVRVHRSHGFESFHNSFEMSSFRNGVATNNLFSPACSCS